MMTEICAIMGSINLNSGYNSVIFCGKNKTRICSASYYNISIVDIGKTRRQEVKRKELY